MSLRSRLKQLELRTSGSICVKDHERDAMTDLIRSRGNPAERERIAAIKWVLCQCPACQEKRHERENDRQFQELSRFIRRRAALVAPAEESVTQ